MLDSLISTFRNVRDTQTPHDRPLKLVLNRIKEGSPNTLSKIQKIREMSKKGKDVRPDKITLPNFCFSGTFTVRKYEDGNQHNLTSYTGLILLDFDDLSDIEKVRSQIIADPYTFVCFKSVTAKGLKVLVQTDNQDHRLHKNYVQEVINYYSKYGCIDENGSGIAQGTYDSYDPELYVHPGSTIWTDKADQVETHYQGKKEFQDKCEFALIITDEYSLYKQALEWRQKYDSFAPGFRNRFIYNLGLMCNKFGISENYAIQCCQNDFTEKDFGSEEIANSVKSAYRKRSVFNTIKIRDKEKYKIIRSMRENNAPKAQIIKMVRGHAKESNSKIKDEDIELAYSEIESEVKGVYQTFWDTFQKDPDKPESPYIVHFNYQKWFQWNKQNGVFLYYPAGDRSGDYMFIRIRNNIVTPLDKSFFSRVIKDYLESLPPVVDFVTRETLINKFARDIETIISRRKLEMLAESPVNFINDTKDNTHFYFRNAIVRITAKEIETIGYEQVNECVWEKKIIKRPLVDLKDEQRTLEDYLLMGKGSFDFGDWILKTCDEDMNSAKNLCAVLGYLMHGFKDQSNPRAVIFLETPLAGNPEGGTGKGILIQAIQQMRAVIRENGKIANPKDKFWAQSVKLDTDIFCIEDVQRNFDFEDIFSVITDGITVEDKYKSKFYIPYERSPKIALTSNYPFRGGGSSHERRKYEFELSHNFKKRYKDPISHYGKRFFSADWDEGEWQLFYYFMFECSRYFLSLGGALNIIPSEALSIRKFTRNTSSEWAAFAAANIKPGVFYAKAELRKQYLETATVQKNLISVQKVSDYVKEFAKYSMCEMVEKIMYNHRGFVLIPAEGQEIKTDLRLIALKNDSGLDVGDEYCEEHELQNSETEPTNYPKTELPF
jgi:hypothetical protein